MVASKDRLVKPLPFHDAELRRGWRVLHARADVALQPARRLLRARAALRVAVLGEGCACVALHLRACDVLRVRVCGVDAEFSHADPTRDKVMRTAISGDGHRRRVDEMLPLQASLAPRDGPGELRVALPNVVVADVVERLRRVRPVEGEAAIAAAAAASTNAPLPPMVTSVDQLPTVEVVVEYVLVVQTAAVAFFDGPHRVVVDGRGGKARAWLPCVDSREWCDRCTWDLVYNVPEEHVAVSSGKLVETRLILCEEDDDEHAVWRPRGGDERAEGDRSDSDVTEVPLRRQSSRRLAGSDAARPHTAQSQSEKARRRAEGVERMRMPYPLKRYSYRLDAPAHAGDLAVAVGPFLPLAEDNTPTSDTHFCLPGRSRDLVHTVPDVFARVKTFCCDYFNMEPPGCPLKLVFAGETHVGSDPAALMREPWVHANCAAGGLVVLPESLLHSDRCIDEGFHSRMAVAYALVSAYVGCLIRPRAAEDAWFVVGLAAHVTTLTLTYVLGKNWYNVYVHDRIREMSAEDGATAPVLADAAKDPSFCMSTASPSVRRRALLITYLVEKRIGSEVLRRVLRDLVAETTRSLSSGNAHDEVQQGLAVGPFLKRIRAVCGTDVRNLVRSWAASRGTPRVKFGYRYNARRHQAEFAIEQRAVAHGERMSSGREGLLFQGSLTVRVMEPEGIFDHTVEVIDPVFVAELSCHCRRTKQKPVTQAEKDAGEEPVPNLPISWARVDPEMEWCMDVSFIQTELAWVTMLQGERDAVAQISACRGLAEYGTVTAAKALSECLRNAELFWRVRMEAAKALAKCETGVERLLDFFEVSYTEVRKSASEAERAAAELRGQHALHDPTFRGGLVGNNFADFGDYMVRRAVIRAVVSPWLTTRKFEDVPAGVCSFILKVLTENDNSRNRFDDDHYVSDLISCASTVAVRCIGAGPSGAEMAHEITEQIRRYRRIDEFVPSRSGAVAAAIALALADIETSHMAMDASSRTDGKGAIEELLKCQRQPEAEFMRHVTHHATPSSPLRARTACYIALARVYGADLEALQWVISRVDRASTGVDVLEMDGLPPEDGKTAFVEPRCVRRAVIHGILGAVENELWKTTSPILTALRRNTKRAMSVCARILRLVVADCDEGVRALALDVALAVWGRGVPVCLLGISEYRQMRAKGTSHGRSSVIREYSKNTTPLGRIKKPVIPASAPSVTSRKPLVIPKSVAKKVDRIVLPKLPKSKPAALPSFIPRSQPVGDSARNGGPKVPLSVAKESTRPTKTNVVPPISMILSKPAPPVVKVVRDVDALMVEEDREYLRRLWEERRHRYEHGGMNGSTPKKANGIREVNEEPAVSIVRIKSGGDVTLVGDTKEVVTPPVKSGEVIVIDGEEDEEERKRRRKEKKERKRMKKKRRREGEAGGGGEGEEGDETQHKRKKKKKKKRDRGESAAASPGGSGAASIGVSSSHGASGEGSFPSEGKLQVLKINLKVGAGQSHVSKS